MAYPEDVKGRQSDQTQGLDFTPFTEQEFDFTPFDESEFSTDEKPQKGTFGEGVKAGTQQLVAGGQIATGALANAITGEAKQDRRFDLLSQLKDPKERARIFGESRSELENLNKTHGTFLQRYSELATKNPSSDPSMVDPEGTAGAIMADAFYGSPEDKKFLKENKKKYEELTARKSFLEKAVGDFEAIGEKEAKLGQTGAYEFYQKHKEGEGFGDKVLQKGVERRNAIPERSGFAYNLGNMVPQAVGILGAVGASYFTGGSSSALIKMIPTVLGNANAAALTLSAFGDSYQNYKEYLAEKGIVADETTALVMGAGAAGIEYLSEKLPFDKLMPKALTSKIIAGQVMENPRLGIDLVENWIKKNPKKFNDFYKGVKGMISKGNFEGVSEAAAELGYIAMEDMYKDPDDRVKLNEAFNRMGQSYLYGSILGGFVEPASAGAQARATNLRRKNNGVNLASTKDGNGKVFELVGKRKDGSYVAMDNEGNESVLQPDNIDKHIFLKPDELTQMLDAIKQAKPQADAIKREVMSKKFGSEFREQIKGYVADNGMINSASDSRNPSREVAILGDMDANNFIVFDPALGKRVTMPKSRLIPKEQIDVEQYVKSNVDQAVNEYFQSEMTEDDAAEALGLDKTKTYNFAGQPVKIEQVFPNGQVTIYDPNKGLESVVSLTPEEAAGLRPVEQAKPAQQSDIPAQFNVDGKKIGVETLGDGTTILGTPFTNLEKAKAKADELNSKTSAFQFEAVDYQPENEAEFRRAVVTVKRKEQQAEVAQDETPATQQPPLYSFQGTEITKAKAKAKILMAKKIEDIESLEVSNDPELQAIIEKKFPQVPASYKFQGEEIDRETALEIINEASDFASIAKDLEVQGDSEIESIMAQKLTPADAQAIIPEQVQPEVAAEPVQETQVSTEREQEVVTEQPAEQVTEEVAQPAAEETVKEEPVVMAEEPAPAKETEKPIQKQTKKAGPITSAPMPVIPEPEEKTPVPTPKNIEEIAMQELSDDDIFSLDPANTNWDSKSDPRTVGDLMKRKDQVDKWLDKHGDSESERMQDKIADTENYQSQIDDLLEERGISWEFNYETMKNDYTLEQEETETETATQKVAIAPFFDTKVSTIEQARKLRKTGAYRNYKKTMEDVAGALGIEITGITENIGGYVNDSGNKIVEISNTVEINGTLDQAEEFAAIMRSMAAEVQESAYANQYTEPGTPDHLMDEVRIEVSDLDNTIIALRESGIDEFTIEESNNIVSFYDFSKGEDKDFRKKLTKFAKALDINGVNYGEQERRAVKSRRVGTEESRRVRGKINEDAIRLERGGKNLRNILEEASQRDEQYEERIKAKQQPAAETTSTEPAKPAEPESLRILGYPIKVKNKKGSIRQGKDKNGRKWAHKLENDYGEIEGVEGADGENMDVFLGKNPNSRTIYVIDQSKDNGEFDEHKVMMGFGSATEAESAYLSNYEQGWDNYGTIREFTKEEFDEWVSLRRKQTEEGAQRSKSKAESKIKEKARIDPKDPASPWYSSSNSVMRKMLKEFSTKVDKNIRTEVVLERSELPKYIQFLDFVGGVYYQGTAYFVVSELSDTKDAAKTWMHEVGVHVGLRKLFSDKANYNDKMKEVYESVKKTQKMAEIKAAYPDYDKVALADEYLAYLGEEFIKGTDFSALEKDEKGAWNTITSWIRSITKKIMPEQKMSDRQIAELIVDSYRVAHGKEPLYSKKKPGDDKTPPDDGRSRRSLISEADIEAGIIGEPTEIKEVPETRSRRPVDVRDGYQFSHVKPDDLIDIRALIKDIQEKKQKVWFWMGDQLGRGSFTDPVTGKEHFIDGGISFALDPENRKSNIVWASSSSPKTLMNYIGQSDYIFIISGSPTGAHAFNKSVFNLLRSRVEETVPFEKFRKDVIKVSSIEDLTAILRKFKSFDDILDAGKIRRKNSKGKEVEILPRKDLLNILSDQSTRIRRSPLVEILEKYNALINLNDWRDDFLRDNDFMQNEITLVLKPHSIDSNPANHSTYSVNIIGEVIGVPNERIDAYEILPEQHKSKLAISAKTKVIAAEAGKIHGATLERIDSEVRARRPMIATPEFQKWFGASKIVDENGDPKVMYHGTNADFDEFRNNPDYVHRKGIFVTPNTDFTEQFTSVGGSVLPLYVRAEKPFSFENEEDIQNVASYIKGLKDDGDERMRILYERFGSDEYKQGRLINNLKLGKWTTIESLVPVYEALGYDSYYVEEDNTMNLAVLDPNQLKSAIGNSGQFSTESNDVRARKVIDVNGRKVFKANDKISSIREVLQDRMISVRNVQDEVLSRGGIMDETTNAYEEENRSDSKSLMAIQRFDDEIFKPMLEFVVGMSKEFGIELSEIQYYLKARHALERNEYLSKKTGRDVNSGIASNIAQKAVDDFERKVGPKATLELWKQIRKSTNYILNRYNDDGFLKPETYAEIKKRYKFYVPLRGWKVTEKIEDIFSYLDDAEKVSYSPIKKAEGRLTESDDPLAFIQSMAHSAIVSGNKNKVKQAAARMILMNKGMSDIFEMKNYWKVKTGRFDQNGIEIEDIVETKPPQAMFDQGLVSRTFTRGDHMALRTSDMASQHEVDVFMNGERYTMVFHDPAVANALARRNAVAPEITAAFQKTFAPFTRTLSMLATSKNPAFIPVNFLRDMMYATTALSVEGDISAAKAMANVPTAINTIRKHLYGSKSFDPVSNTTDKLYMEFLDNGGQTGFVHLKEIAQLQKQLARKAERLKRKLTGKATPMDYLKSTISMLDRNLDKFATMSENATRFAVYKAAKEDGKTINEAIKAAKNVTVNFNRKGTASSLVGSLFAFFNASMQGSQNFVRLGKRHTKKFVVGAVMFAALGKVLSELCMDWGGEDEEGVPYYQLLSDWVKHTNIVIPDFRKKGDFITIPLPHGFRAIYSLGVLWTQMLNEEKTAGETVTSAISNFMESLSPVNATSFINEENELTARPVIPTAAVPVYDLIVNEDFTGKEVYNTPFMTTWDNKVADSKLGKSYVAKPIENFTSWLFQKATGGSKIDSKLYVDEGKIKKVPDLLDLNPSKIEHLLEGYLGGLGKFSTNVVKTAHGIMEAVDATRTENKDIWEALEGSVNVNFIPVANRLYQSPYGTSYSKKFTVIRDQAADYDFLMKRADKAKDYETMVELYSIEDRLTMSKIYEGNAQIIKDIMDSVYTSNDPALIEEGLKQRDEIIKNTVEAVEEAIGKKIKF